MIRSIIPKLSGRPTKTPILFLPHFQPTLTSIHHSKLHQHAKYNTETEQLKPNLKFLSQLRKETQCSITKAREALLTTQNDYALALEWIHQDAIKSGLKKAEKLNDRVAAEGLIGVKIFSGGRRGGSLVEVNCETDFVGRSDGFKNFVRGVNSVCEDFNLSGNVGSDALIQEIDTESVSKLHLGGDDVSKSVHQRQIELIGQLGENIQIRRVAVINPQESNLDGNSVRIAGGYTHGGPDQSSSDLGRIGAIVSLKVSPGENVEPHSQFLTRLARQLAQHVVGFAPRVISGSDGEDVMLRQTFLPSGGEKKVGEVLESLKTEKDPPISVEIEAFNRFECGEGIEKVVAGAEDFKSEVMKQAGLA
ncbi:hypothetical protein HK098_007964 [Nowakowskiella sp. JEL0407]|nr:hypothetical protein HK098_007964 [Nowakowskiella sp. JEL0407]